MLQYAYHIWTDKVKFLQITPYVPVTLDLQQGCNNLRLMKLGESCVVVGSPVGSPASRHNKITVLEVFEHVQKPPKTVGSPALS